MNADQLTRPEGYVAAADRRRVGKQVRRDGGCTHCLHSQYSEFLGRPICPRDAGRSFPGCVNDQRTPTFELDESTIRRHGDA